MATVTDSDVFRTGEFSLKRIDQYRWLIPKRGKMRVDGLIYADRDLLEEIVGPKRDKVEALQQVANVACLPGIIGRSIGMPDIHWGYGFVIGGVAAFDPDLGGVVSPGGVGYDINCGVRLLRSTISEKEIRPYLADLMNQIMRDVPAGVGRGYKTFKLSPDEVSEVLREGAGWAVRKGFGTRRDLERTEGSGVLPNADPGAVSRHAVQRGGPQLGTVGSGNHFIEINYVSEIFDPGAAERLGLEPGTVCTLIHSGSRGLGYQVCDDYLKVMLEAVSKYGIELPDRQLACAPLTSPEAKRYLGAMNAAANYAFANRQMMAFRVREAFARILDRPWGALGLEMVYDVAHNIAKWEDHLVDGETRRLCIHRKGATRAFPPGSEELPEQYRDIGQPVLIPGDMARYSYVLLGTEAAYRETWGSTCHGAGRRMSRTQAKKSVRGRSLKKEFAEQGLEVRASSYRTIAEEVPEAYKDVAEVVDVVDRAGIAHKVAQLRPLGVLKG